MIGFIGVMFFCTRSQRNTKRWWMRSAIMRAISAE